MSWGLIFIGLLVPWALATAIGRGKERGGEGFMLGLLLSWIGLLILLLLPAGGMTCPLCREKIKHDARVCRFCGATIEVVETWKKKTVRATPRP